LHALAVVVHDSMAEMDTKLFFTYFPTVFRARVFNVEAEARRWLEQQLIPFHHTYPPDLLALCPCDFSGKVAP